MDRNLIADKLVSLRGDRKRSDIADAIGISVSALSMYEAGKRVPRDEIKVTIAHYYGTTVESLFFSNEPHISCEIKTHAS